MSSFKRAVRRTFRRMGFDVVRLGPNTDPALQLLKGMEHFGVTVVLDVGGNSGQFATGLREAGFRGRIVSFEPLSAAHAALVLTAQGDSRWDVHPRCAIGAENGEVTINIAGNSVSSSVLPMLAMHAEAASGSAYVGAEKAPQLSLDEAAQQYLEETDRAFVKIDTQGYEWEVLDGAERVLRRATVGVLCELSLVPLYEGQKLWRDLITRMEGMGFALWGIQEGFSDSRNGRTLQIDATFYRVA